MRFLLSLFFTASLILISALPASQAQENDYQIAAVVNDDIITRLQLEERMQLAIATTGLPDTPEVHRQLLGRILQNLVDESLQAQEAKKNSITVDPSEIDHAISSLEEARGRPPGSLVGFLAAKGVPEDTFRKQLETQIAWNKLIGKKIKKDVKISREEVDTELARRQSPAAKKEEVLLASLVLPVESPEAETSTRELAGKLYKEIQKGASFDALSSQLSSTQVATIGATWVDVGQLEPGVAAKVDTTKAPGFIPPVRTPSGYQILWVKEKRETSVMRGDAELSFKRIQLSLDAAAQNKEVDVLMTIAREVRKSPGPCTQKGVAGIKSLEGLNIAVDYQRSKLSALSSELQPLVEGLNVGQVSEPFATPKGIELLMLCERTVMPAPVPDRDKIEQQLFRQKLELEAEKYLRNMRRSAFVDIRVHQTRAPSPEGAAAAAP